MDYHTIERFSSKRNCVVLAQAEGCSGEEIVVKDFSQNRAEYELELRVSKALLSRGVAVPKILKTEDGKIFYQYINGIVTIDILEKMEKGPENEEWIMAFDKICIWLSRCYKALREEFSKEMILGDIHLRNFIWNKEIYGVDFECVCEGKIETDIARLAVFTVTYNPSCTPIKYKIASYIVKKAEEYMKLDKELIIKEMNSQLEGISKRRKITFPPNIVENIEKGIENL